MQKPLNKDEFILKYGSLLYSKYKLFYQNTNHVDNDLFIKIKFYKKTKNVNKGKSHDELMKELEHDNKMAEKIMKNVVTTTKVLNIKERPNNINRDYMIENWGRFQSKRDKANKLLKELGCLELQERHIGGKCYEVIEEQQVISVVEENIEVCVPEVKICNDNDLRDSSTQTDEISMNEEVKQVDVPDMVDTLSGDDDGKIDDADWVSPETAHLNNKMKRLINHNKVIMTTDDLEKLIEHEDKIGKIKTKDDVNVGFLIKKMYEYTDIKKIKKTTRDQALLSFLRSAPVSFGSSAKILDKDSYGDDYDYSVDYDNYD
jgi:hypothetical protein